MANPLDPNRLVAEWRNRGLDIFENSGWQTHNRDAGRAPFQPNGIMIHHTGGDTTNPDLYASKSGVLWVGRPDLPGPLCLAGVGMNARIYMQGFGRTNHAGTGDSSVLNAVINETVPMDRELRPSKNDVDGNSRFYGFEVMYSGGHPMSAIGYRAVVLASAIICKLHGWSARSIIGHREWTNTKPDPGYCPMDQFRRDVQALLDSNFANTNTNNPPPQEDDMPSVNDLLQAPIRRSGPGVDTNSETSIGAVMSWFDANVVGIRGEVVASQAATAALINALAAKIDGEDIDVAAVQAAANAGAKAALEEMIDSATVELNVDSTS